MIRSGIEYRNAKKQIEDLRSELDRLTSAEPDEILRGVISALEMKISDIEHELDEYENLKKGHVFEFYAKSLDELGEDVTKARIARGWNQTELARALGMESPQITRYERNDWQKISVWRLQEVIEALGLNVEIRTWLHDHEDQDIELPQPMLGYKDLYSDTASSLDSGIAYTTSEPILTVPQVTSEANWDVSKWAKKGITFSQGGIHNPTRPRNVSSAPRNVSSAQLLEAS